MRKTIAWFLLNEELCTYSLFFPWVWRGRILLKNDNLQIQLLQIRVCVPLRSVINCSVSCCSSWLLYSSTINFLRLAHVVEGAVFPNPVSKSHLGETRQSFLTLVLTLTRVGKYLRSALYDSEDFSKAVATAHQCTLPDKVETSMSDVVVSSGHVHPR